MIADYLRRVGFLRAVLMLATVLLIFLSPFAGGHIQTSGWWPLVTTLVAPVCFVIFIFVLCLDMLMTRVFMSGSSDAERRRLTMIIRSEALLLVILLVSWAPLVLTLMRLRES